jgi:valyl-tRNA synthetase
MSKTKGNVVDPLEVINTMGADAMRFALVHGSEPSAEQRMSDTRIEGARNFANKLWNAARFVVNSRPSEIPPDAPLEPPDPATLGPAEHWILVRTQLAVAAAERAYSEYMFGEVTRVLYDATWNDLCDWYLEIAKLSLAPEAEPQRRITTWRTLTWVLDRLLRLLHPVMPHITEAIWSRLPHLADDADLLVVARWPDATGLAADAVAAGGAAELIELITSIRAARAESGVDVGDILPAVIWLADGPARAAFPALAPAIGRLARVQPSLAEDRATLEDGLAVVTAFAEARLTRSQASRERERVRLEKEIANLQAQLSATEARLADVNFTGRAPATVVDKARRHALELAGQIAALTDRRREV